MQAVPGNASVQRAVKSLTAMGVLFPKVCYNIPNSGIPPIV
jgi:hypothetical protein